MKKLTLIGASALLSLAAFSASVHADVKDAIEFRQGIFKAYKWNFGPMAAMVQGKADYNADEFIKRANNLQALSTQPWEAFVAGSYTGDTDALAKIEKSAQAYQQKIDAFEAAANKLAEAAQTKDMKQIRAAFGATGKTCKSCHDQFRQ